MMVTLTQKDWSKWFFEKMAAGDIIDQRDDIECGSAANAEAKVLLTKRSIPAHRYRPQLFNDLMAQRRQQQWVEEHYAVNKAAVSDPLRGPREEDDDKLSSKLKAMVDAMIVAAPSLKREHAMHFLLHTAHGRALALHLNSISKTERQPPMLDVSKLIPVIEEGLMAQAKLAKRDGESVHQSFARLHDTDSDFRATCKTAQEARHMLALGKSVNMTSTTPVSVEVGNTNVKSDAEKAFKQLNALAEQQHRTFEQVFLDPEYKALATATYQRSSPSYDELM